MVHRDSAEIAMTKCNSYEEDHLVPVIYAHFQLNFCQIEKVAKKPRQKASLFLIFNWCHSDAKSSDSCRNWNYRVRMQFNKYNLQENYQILWPVEPRLVCSLIVEKVYDDFVQKWHTDLNRTSARRGTGGNKLRTYRQMKKDFQVEPYCLEILSRKHRGALAKFRSGTAPIKVETGRYQNLDLSERVCFHLCPLC